MKIELTLLMTLMSLTHALDLDGNVLLNAGAAEFDGDLVDDGDLVTDGAAFADGDAVAYGGSFAGAGANFVGPAAVRTQNINMAPRVVTKRVMGKPRVITENVVEPVY